MRMFALVVTHLDGTVASVIGPFWDSISAEAFGNRNVKRLGFRYSVNAISERGVWLAANTPREGRGKR
jgi:hypothetical protein